MCIEPKAITRALPMKAQKNGFTLIELLVVIAIIALLMSILMPALSKVKIQAKNLICLSNLRQWGIAISMYIQENDNRFLGAHDTADPDLPTGGWAWMEVLRSSYKEDKLHLCPRASKKPDHDYASGSTFVAWNPGTTDNPLYGSYGLNGWMAHPGNGGSVYGRPVDRNWTLSTAKEASKIPVIADCGIWDSWPLEIDQPPAFEFAPVEHGVLNSEIKRFCLNRHNGAINVTFLDFSARKVGLKELWHLKWHKNWPPGDDHLPVWPEWMQRFKDYNY
jgi:prepilin-type N-terminal cleavage/methylation domain-containing protein/prepilin-type processing-associated H-X9-DG protein